jgi:hypothetical protein
VAWRTCAPPPHKWNTSATTPAAQQSGPCASPAPAPLPPQVFTNAYFWLLSTVALSGAATPLARRLGTSLGQPVWEVDVPEGLLLDSNGDPVSRAKLEPSAVLATAAAVAVTTWDAMHHSSFTVNNMVCVRGVGRAWCVSCG